MNWGTSEALWDRGVRQDTRVEEEGGLVGSDVVSMAAGGKDSEELLTKEVRVIPLELQVDR